MSQGPVGNAFDAPSIEACDDYCNQQDNHQGNNDVRNTHKAEYNETDSGDKSANHIDLTMRKIDHADDPINHGVANGDEPIHGAKGQAINQLLKKIFHDTVINL